jgi:hypothetical protein
MNTQQGSHTLDAFFPFDPFTLKVSSGFVKQLYQEWQANEDNEEDEDTLLVEVMEE